MIIVGSTLPRPTDRSTLHQLCGPQILKDRKEHFWGQRNHAALLAEDGFTDYRLSPVAAAGAGELLNRLPGRALSPIYKSPCTQAGEKEAHETPKTDTHSTKDI